MERVPGLSPIGSPNIIKNYLIGLRGLPPLGVKMYISLGSDIF